MKFQSAATLFMLASIVSFISPSATLASDWQEDGPKTAQPAQPYQDPNDQPQPAPRKKRMKPISGRIESNDADMGGIPQKGRLDSQNPLSGSADANNDALQGNAQDDGPGSLTPMTPRSGGKPILQGGATQSDYGPQGDPDMDDQELQVDWDRWRNKFLFAVQGGVQEALNNPDDVDLRFDPAKGMVVVRFPLGTVAWFHCKVSADRHIMSAKIKQSSGFPNFDNAVIASIHNLEGSTVLRFPKRSQRQFVTQTAGIKTADSPERQYFKFGDVERYRTPGQ